MTRKFLKWLLQWITVAILLFVFFDGVLLRLT